MSQIYNLYNIYNTYYVFLHVIFILTITHRLNLFLKLTKQTGGLKKKYILVVLKNNKVSM